MDLVDSRAFRLELLRARDLRLRRSAELRRAAAQTVEESREAVRRARALCDELERIRADIKARRQAPG